MKLANKDLQIILAGEYVLGTLKGRARKRFESLLRTRRDLRSAVDGWEQNLAPLTLEIGSVSPPPELWERIARDVHREPQVVKPHRSEGFWPKLAIAASLVAVLFGGLLLTRLNQGAQPVEVAVLGNGTKPAWVMTLSHTGHTLEVAAIQPILKPGHSYQLWMLPGKGRAPVSLGLLPVQPGARLQVTVSSQLRLAKAQGLAVSLEPPKGSPLPGPSGPIMYEARWLPIARSS